jgi:hypothetical protein
MHRERNRIDRMIGHLKINGAIATRSDKLARSFLDALHIAAIRRYLRYATLQTGPHETSRADCRSNHGPSRRFNPPQLGAVADHALMTA